MLIPPLVGIYRKSFPAKATWSFLGLFILGALLAGALMDALVGNAFQPTIVQNMMTIARFMDQEARDQTEQAVPNEGERHADARDEGVG